MNRDRVSLDSVRHLHLEMGFPCNVRCAMCYQGDYTQKMDPRLWRRALAPLYPSLSRLFVSGGEPTVLPATRKLIALVLSVNPSIRLGTSTNGILFDEFWREAFVRHGQDVNFSLNAASKPVHERINRGSRFETVMENLRLLIARRRECGCDLGIQISMVVISENAHEIFDFLRLGRELGVWVRFYYDATRLPSPSTIIVEEGRRCFDFIRENPGAVRVSGLETFFRHYCWRWGIEDRLLGSAPGNNKGSCRAPWSALDVDRHGQVRFCCMSSLILGNLHERGIEEIWNGEPARSFRRRMAAADYGWCQAWCASNPHPRFAFDRARLTYYMKRFATEFRASPNLALHKAVRRARELRSRRPPVTRTS